MVGSLPLLAHDSPISAGALIHHAAYPTTLLFASCLLAALAVIFFRRSPPFRFLTIWGTRSRLGSASFMMFAALNLQIDLSPLLPRPAGPAPPSVTCHIAT